MFASIIWMIRTIGIFDLSVRILIILLPFTTLIWVFTKYKLGISGVTFYKEFLILILAFSLLFFFLTRKIQIKWGMMDVLIWGYILIMILVSLFTTGLPWIIYGWRYDFSFLIIFWILWHSGNLLHGSTALYLKLALISMGTMIFLSALLKYPFSEDLLLYLGYGWNPSAWQFSSAPPIFHGIDGANIRRFQWILDGPNTMGAFLLFFISIFTYYFRSFKDWYFVNGCIIWGLCVMVVYTYSRSALLGLLGAMAFALIWSAPFLYKKYKKQTITILLVWTTLLWLIFFQYSGRLAAIIGREGSTKWHFERMSVGIERTISAPLGQWLGSAGPAYRYIQDLGSIPREKIEEMDRFYIPESWYIQQFIEGGIIGGVLFLLIMLSLFVFLLKKHIILASMFFAVATMNLFLHTFESSAFSLLFFLIIAIIIRPYAERKNT